MSKAIAGDTAVWYPNGSKGVKVMSPKYKSNLDYLTSISDYTDYCAEVYGYQEKDDELHVECKNIEHVHASSNDFIGRCAAFFIKNQILPDKGWSKQPKNTYNNLLLDYHSFKHTPEHYMMPVKDIGKIEEIHKEGLAKFAALGTISGGLPKRWKGKIYEGMIFSDGKEGYSMEGYSSDGVNFDSYLKMQFSCVDFFKGRSVLDLGSNNGFFCHQARIAGASKSVGVELAREDIELAENINKEIVSESPFTEFHQLDIRDYLQGCEEFNIAICHSVAHQCCDGLRDYDKFFGNLADKVTDTVIFETPYNHPRMNFPLHDVEVVLKKHFNIVRPLYNYDCYSTGRRQLYSLIK